VGFVFTATTGAAIAGAGAVTGDTDCAT